MSLCKYLCCALFWVVALATNADVIDNFYDIDVEVDAVDKADMAAAAGLGLQNMLIRASGREDIMENEVLQDALQSASDYISQYGFIQIDAAEPNADARRFVRFTFSQDIVERLLNRAGEPVWTKDRPSSLVWLAIDEDSELTIATAGSTHYRTLAATAAARGLPLVSPLYDIEDRFALASEQVWQFDTSAIREASSRYPSNVILAVRALKDSQGQWHSSWELLGDSDALLGSDNCIVLRDCFDTASQQLAEYWSARYAVTKKYSTADVLAVRLKNANFQAFSDVARYWRNLSGVDDVQVVSVDGLDINFELVWRSDADTFKQLIALHDHLALADQQSEEQIIIEWFQ